jgi:rhamnosyltransferase
MSTFNGEEYLPEQLDSILSQKGVDIKIVVRDDGSTDRTLDILKTYQQKYGCISIESDGGNLKPCRSFLKLISENTESDYFALSDQDDIWDDNKLFSAISKLADLPEEKPAMYFSNLRIVDSNNKFYRNSHSSRRDLKNKYNALIATAATGCTIVYNRRLAQIAAKVKPRTFSMHDTWIYMTCAFFGNIVYDFEPHINYRQHGNNVIGTSLTKNRFPKFSNELKRLFNRNLQPRYDNAVEFLREFGTELSGEDLDKVLEVVNYKRTRESKRKLLSDPDIIPDDRFNRFRIKMLIYLGIV